MKNKNIIYIYSAVIFLIIISSIFAEKISGYSPYELDFSGALRPCAGHILGTDFLGRDILSRTLIGGRISILIGVAARTGSVILGLFIGIISGLSKSIRPFLNGLVEVFLSIPSLLLAMGLAVVLGEGYMIITISIVAGTWAPVARFTAVKVIEINSRDFILSGRAIGASEFRITAHYIIPELLPVLLPVLTTGIATSIMMESTLSFLGLAGGGYETMPSWGSMIQEGAKFMFDAPWIIIPPSVILTLLILGFNRIGDKLADSAGQ